ncbi:MAG TPA: hypothetical protein ENN46_03510 [Candidatus Woesearchaeota archaeon]|nr:hypothetical protein [Candidatus Woesearchaeota archaeon]
MGATEVIVAGGIAVVIASLMLSLAEITDEIAGKTESFASDINSAMDCAVRGIPVAVCAPKLANTDFKSDLSEYSQLIHETVSEIEKGLNSTSSD